MAKKKSNNQSTFETTIKNLFRQHFNRQSRSFQRAVVRNSSYWKEFQKARQVTPIEKLPVLYSLVEQKPAYSFEGLGNAFVFDNSRFIDVRLQALSPLSLSRELAIQIARLNYYSSKLESAILSVAQLNAFIVSGNWVDAQVALNNHNVEFGTSIIVLKKEMLITLELGSLSALSKRSKAVSSKFGGSAYALINRFIRGGWLRRDTVSAFISGASAG